MRPKETASHPSGVFSVTRDVSQDIESMEKPCLRSTQEGAGRGLFYLLSSCLLLTPVWPTNISIPTVLCGSGHYLSRCSGYFPYALQCGLPSKSGINDRNSIPLPGDLAAAKGRVRGGCISRQIVSWL